MFARSYLKSNSVHHVYFTLLNSQRKCFTIVSKHVPKGLCNKLEIDKNVETLAKLENKILYNSINEQQKPKLGYRRNKAVLEKLYKQRKKIAQELQGTEPIPLSLKYFNEDRSIGCEAINEESSVQELNNNTIIHFPFKDFDKIEKSHTKEQDSKEASATTQNEISLRQLHYDKEKVIGNWMTDYENYNDRDSELNEESSWRINYGTPDPNAAVSKTPCGGCGALLHCKDTAIPGYIPSEIFKNHRNREGQHLRTLICQRCHFLNYYDMALQVRVSADDYPKILETIKENHRALIILMVDLLDFPCSIWPNIIDIIGNKRPIIVVGNKADLLPKDCKGYLQRIKNILAESVNSSGLNGANIKHVSLISAKTGYGVEELITTLHSLWKYKGDVYLVGSTNVGKSTLFNTLLQSDFCKIKAADLVQRATTSIWPGTTLNLLKFPILRPSGWRLYVRTKRLISLSKIKSEEARLRTTQLRKTKNPKYATLIGHIERSFTAEEPVMDKSDLFAIQGHENASGRVHIGINENSPEYKLSKWCYDTPGVVQADQILHLLTTEELMLTLPKEIIQPRTFSVKPGTTIFLGGLARLDVVTGPISMRFTIFSSGHLPVTICSTSDADNIYKELLGTQFFQVPLGNEQRLQKWPELQVADEIKLTGVDWETSCADVILSSAGWISVTLGNKYECILKAWTPEKRGIYIRNSILPKAVTLRGKRIRDSPAYKKTRFL